MADVVDKATRSRMMSGIRAKNTKPEMQVRRALHSSGLRFRLHSEWLPGRPDIVLPRYRVVIFVHGCFWHGHECRLFKLPSSRTDFWRDKIAANIARDRSVCSELHESGWRTAIVWECSIKGRNDGDVSTVMQPLIEWIKNSVAGNDFGIEIDGC